METFSKLVRYLINLIAAIYLNSLPCCIEYDLTMAASCGMGANFFEEVGADLAIKVIGKLAEEVGAGHAV
jgi:hypothetical protein